MLGDRDLWRENKPLRGHAVARGPSPQALFEPVRALQQPQHGVFALTQQLQPGIEQLRVDFLAAMHCAQHRAARRQSQRRARRRRTRMQMLIREWECAVRHEQPRFPPARCVLGR